MEKQISNGNICFNTFGFNEKKERPDKRKQTHDERT
jgi:hypothetical protein